MFFRMFFILNFFNQYNLRTLPNMYLLQLSDFIQMICQYTIPTLQLQSQMRTDSIQLSTSINNSYITTLYIYIFLCTVVAEGCLVFHF